MEKRIIGRGLIAGALAGLAAFLFARVFAEPLIQDAIGYEGERDEAQHALDRAAGIVVAPHEHEIYSRGIQANIGIGIGMVAFGLVMGALFAVAYAVCLGRVGRVRPRTLALLLAGAGLLTTYVVPFLKYPANPPAVGEGDTIGRRSAYYLIMVLASVLFLIVAVLLGRRLQERFGPWNASLLAVAGFIVAAGLLMALLPSFDETPLALRDPQGNIVFPGFDADLLYHFRLYSLGAQALLWAVLGLVFAPLADRLLSTREAPAERATVDA